MYVRCAYVCICVCARGPLRFLPRFLFPFLFICLFSFKAFIYLFVCFMSMNILLAYVYTMYMPGACRGQKKLSDLLKLELQMVVGCHVGAGNHQNPGSLEEQRVLLTPGLSLLPPQHFSAELTAH